MYLLKVWNVFTVFVLSVLQWQLMPDLYYATLQGSHEDEPKMVREWTHESKTFCANFTCSLFYYW